MAHDSENTESRAAKLRSLRRKLAKLNRAPLPKSDRPAPAPTQQQPTIVYARSLPQMKPQRTTGGGICIPLEDCLDGLEVQGVCGRPYYLLERTISAAEPESADLVSVLPHALNALAAREERSQHVPPHELCFMDIETTGLGCTPVFLIGVLVVRDGDIVCRQFLARDYAEERAIVSDFVAEAQRSPCFVTFNGKSFDVPFLRMRAAATGVDFHEPRTHFDLLHESRRAFRDRLPDCKLQTLERYVCQRYRGDDIPGSEIAQAYHRFVRTGDARDVAVIVKHNLWDLVTMVHLMTKILLPHKDTP
ncbi:ribonuclease H-like domain-containing protein [bacterium]|nr:ribonuclease H-like domain-containing protein [bacterium]